MMHRLLRAPALLGDAPADRLKPVIRYIFQERSEGWQCRDTGGGRAVAGSDPPCVWALGSRCYGNASDAHPCAVPGIRRTSGNSKAATVLALCRRTRAIRERSIVD
ncbi:hypothetical protein NDU88_007812 [Pleurodeles waltl]|uniref:Uncharacterized protein n=1 Tax=Pleurodeles waltl TaxID=8319 RepID=A0AAV7PQ38_PLEWA|nr:hypothetical protein NDU88_007812 [Pleurodeles waltl]